MTAMAHLKPLLFVLWIGVTVSTEVDLQKRIIGGQPCRPNERHYHVKLLVNGTLQCGGSLISDQWILTAAHCRVPGWTMYAELNVHPGPGQEVEISGHKIFKARKFIVFKKKHDIMLLKLPNRVQIQPVPLPDLPDCNNPPNIGAMVQIAGYASTTMGPNNERQNDISGTLQCANITVVDCQWLKNCLQRGKDKYRYQDWFCGQTPGVDISLGDSGGGVVYNGKIYGVIAFTGNGTHACVAVAGFMNICHEPYLKWIQQTIAEPKKCLFNCG